MRASSRQRDVRASHPQIADWLQLIRAEYLEFPDLRLTKAEVERLWELDEGLSEALLAALVQSEFLCRTDNGTYVRSVRSV